MCIHTHTHTHIYIYICVCVCAYIYIYIYIYIIIPNTVEVNESTMIASSIDIDLIFLVVYNSKKNTVTFATLKET